MSRARTGARQLAAIKAALSDRDLAVLHTLADCRYMTSGQLQRWHFPVGTAHHSVDSAARITRRVMARLERQRLVVRLERRIGGVRAGSAGFVYQLGPVGLRVLRDTNGQRRGSEPSARFLDHTLAITEVLVGLVEADRTNDCQLLGYETEPRCWRTFLGAGASREILKPDLAVALGVGDYEYLWFVEIDRGTAHLPTVVRKCRQYVRYYDTGVEQRQRGLFPRVLWLTTADRVEAVRSRIRDESSVLDELFVVGDLVAATWLLAGGEAQP